MGYSIAIDGPAGAGKSTVAKMIAKELGFIYVDTGAMYRAMALYMLENNIEINNEKSVSKACENVDIYIEYRNGEQQVILNGKNVNGFIRTQQVGNTASVTSVNKDVRIKMVDLQQKLAKKADVVMDGRDIGTHVLKDAQLKIYLTADAKIRAKRRMDELEQKGEKCDFEVIVNDIIERDNRDKTRKISPLRQAKDAIVVDSGNMNAEEAAKSIIDIFKEKVK